MIVLEGKPIPKRKWEKYLIKKTATDILSKIDKIIEETDDDLHCEQDTDLVTIDMYTDRLNQGIPGERLSTGLKGLKYEYGVKNDK